MKIRNIITGEILDAYFGRSNKREGEGSIIAGQTKEFIESMEKLKEVQRIQYDYFKHLTTLSTA